jgi:hypothetical protein
VTVKTVPEIVPITTPLGISEETVVPAVTPVPVTSIPGTMVVLVPVAAVIFITVPEIEPVNKAHGQAVER